MLSKKTEYVAFRTTRTSQGGGFKKKKPNKPKIQTNRKNPFTRKKWG